MHGKDHFDLTFKLLEYDSIWPFQICISKTFSGFVSCWKSYLEDKHWFIHAKTSVQYIEESFNLLTLIIQFVQGYCNRMKILRVERLRELIKEGEGSDLWVGPLLQLSKMTLKWRKQPWHNDRRKRASFKTGKVYSVTCGDSGVRTWKNKLEIIALLPAQMLLTLMLVFHWKRRSVLLHCYFKWYTIHVDEHQHDTGFCKTGFLTAEKCNFPPTNHPVSCRLD